MGTPNTGRRGLLGGAVAVAAAAAIPAAAIASETLTAGQDADLIRVSAQHIVNMRASEVSEFDGKNIENDPLWRAYSETRDAITAAKPQTMAGIIAKARATVAEGGEHGGGMDEVWARDVVNDLLRVHGEG